MDGSYLTFTVKGIAERTTDPPPLALAKGMLAPALRASLKAVATACLRFVTLGPRFEPLCSSPFANSPITLLILTDPPLLYPCDVGQPAYLVRVVFLKPSMLAAFARLCSPAFGGRKHMRNFASRSVFFFERTNACGLRVFRRRKLEVLNVSYCHDVILKCKQLKVILRNPLLQNPLDLVHP